MTPAGVEELTHGGTRCVIQTGAGQGKRDQRRAVPRSLVRNRRERRPTSAGRDMIVKVKEPIADEWKHRPPRANSVQILHFAATNRSNRDVMASGVTR